MVKSAVSYTHILNKTMTGPERFEQTETGFHAKTVFEGSISDAVEMKTGVEMMGQTHVDKTNTNRLASFDELVTSFFAEVDVYNSKHFVSRTGLRFEHNSLSNQSDIDPRFSLAYKLGLKGQVSLAYGKFRQSPKNKFVAANPRLKAEKASHYILNYQYVDNKRTFRIEAYYKQYTGLVKFSTGQKGDITNAGQGFARGVEVFWRDNIGLKNADYWISYSLLNTKRNYLDFPVLATPSFASTHNFSAVYKHFIPFMKSQLGFTFSHTSGRRYNNPNEGLFNGSITPAYQDLSFNWSYLPHPAVIVYLSCTNMLGRNNILGYEFSSELNAEGLYNSRAIRQPAKHFVFIGIFITISKEKSVNQLPNL
jgi:outer membrane cobalamin receptor